MQKLAVKIRGIPDRSQFGDLSTLSAGQIAELITQFHEAARAGAHYDIRVGTPETNLFSWASRKGLPTTEQRVRRATLQPVHSYNYKYFQGVIPKGYGAGSVRKLSENKILITEASQDYIAFTIADERLSQRFVFMRDRKNPKVWLLLNKTPTKATKYEKPHFLKIPAEEVDRFIKQMREGDTLQAKIDGAHGLVKLLKDRAEILSYRINQENRPILHTERVFEGRKIPTIPKKYQNSVLRGEIYGVRDNKAIPVQELSGILNSTIAKAIKDKKERDIKLQIGLFDVEQVGKKKIDATKIPYTERLKILEKILKYLPSDTFHIMETAYTPAEATKIWKQIQEGSHPLTEEGVIMRLRDKPKPIKAKREEEIDVYVRDIIPGKGKYSNFAGGFSYSLTPDGPIVGVVGTGFDDATRKLLFENKNDYIGRIARIRAMDVFPSGAARNPVFISFHEG